MNKWIIYPILAILISSQPSQAQSPPDTTKQKIMVGEIQPVEKTLIDHLSGKNVIPGFFKIYQDSTTGQLYLLLEKSQLNKDYIYFNHAHDGVVDAGWFVRGAYQGSRIFTLRKHFNQIEFVFKNTSYYFDPTNPLSRAADANISEAVTTSQKIIFHDEEKNQYLIDIDGVLRSEALHQITQGINPADKTKNKFKLGKIDKSKTKITSIKNYPENTDVVVQYVYNNPTPTNYGSGGVTDARYTAITLQHSFIQLPNNNYSFRLEDPRIGYFSTQVTDMTSIDVAPYRDYIHRWNLKKKHPNKDISEPIKPIVWWIENTTPYEFRDAIKEGVLRWNKAFEKAGFKNAMQVKIQPDDARWDAGDIRYNVLRWTSSPNPPFGGLGPSFVNPLTGEILGADIMLEYVYFTNRVKYEQLFQAKTHKDSEQNQYQYCNYGASIQDGNLYAKMFLNNNSLNGSLEEHRLIEESIIELVLHEVGHTLGLNHNFFASMLHPFKDIHNRSITEPIGLTSSVMDYAYVNVSPDNHGQFYTTTPGPYDVWAIQYGYDPNEDNLLGLLNKSTDPALGFGNDADDMRSPGRGIDPRIMINDMSNDPLAYAEERIGITNDLMKGLKDRYTKEGKTFHELNNAFGILFKDYSLSANTISRYIGGIYIDRSVSGQSGANQPLTPTPYETQKKAMQLLSKFIFSETAMPIHSELIPYLKPQRRGFSGTPDPKTLNMRFNIQKNVLNHLLHINVMKRITETTEYGNNYSLNDVIGDIIDAGFKSDATGNVSSSRANLQTEITNRLIIILENKGKKKYNHLSVESVYFGLLKIKKYIHKKHGANTTTKAHREYLDYRIKKTLEN
ncbi:MAG: DUF5117 domain-containing protein [Candidatus Marinimicrobia bacterium]|nr:DUF5117 domain-containing protein [Candidatus Neomarinimicrobiota bacterium]MBT6112887.1 DUF5117 domain-containing protein [Candidatus Neomarinimicrobiota bacterium]